LKSESDAIEYHAQLALDWEERYAARRSFRVRHAILAALLEKAVRPGERWLDAGCGTGHFSRQMARLGAHVTGVDGAESMITRARSLGADAPGSVVYREASDLSRLPDADGCFDGVLCSSVLEYLGEPERALSELRRVMRTGGALVVTLPNARAVVRRVLALQFAVTSAILKRPSPAYLAHIRHLWSPSEARSFVSAAGYDLQSLRAGGLGVGPAWLDRRSFWGPLLFVSARKRQG
jgi:2-polyprenyl-6-hydroxyphenyl methylase/3-demethylubiquinone-9 3-methyltransferase